MLESIGYLTTLEELQIWCSTIPTDVFAHTLMHAAKLAKVYLFRVGLDGNQMDMNTLARSIKSHPSLRDVRIGGFYLLQPTVTIDSVVQSLGETRTLEVVSLQLSGSQRSVPCGGQALSLLFRTGSITDLYLSRLGLANEHLVVIAQALGENNSLRSLDLFGNHIENTHIVQIAGALEKNTTLEALVLPCPSTDLSVEACSAISQALRTNTSLHTFNLPRSNLSDEGIAQLAQGLTVNRTLKKIEVGVSKEVGLDGLNALTAMLENNYELERVVVSSADQSIKQKAEYYMRLNEYGRGKILRDGNATREAWVDILTACVEDLDCLFYFLKTNPSICQFANVTAQAPFICTHEVKISRRHTLTNVQELSHHHGNGEATSKNRRASAF